MNQATNLYPLSGILEVMKPCRLNKDNPKHMKIFEEALRDESNYIAEEKIDGCHYLTIESRFFSTRESVRTGVPVEKTDRMPLLAIALRSSPGSGLILDGEVTIPGGKSQDVITITGSLPDLALQKQESGGFLHYKVFDILRTPEGIWTTQAPWWKRRQLLESLFQYIEGPYVHLSKVIYQDKKLFLDTILDRGGEGIVLKNINDIYHPGKRPMWNWIKYKVEDQDDVVIMGFEPPTMEYTGKDLGSWPYWLPINGINTPVTKHFYHGLVGTVVFGKYNQSGELQRVGVCSGFDETLRKDFTEHPNKYLGRVAEIKFMERTPDGAYRHPALVAVHPDKNAKECVLPS